METLNYINMQYYSLQMRSWKEWNEKQKKYLTWITANSETDNAFHPTLLIGYLLDTEKRMAELHGICNRIARLHVNLDNFDLLASL